MEMMSTQTASDDDMADAVALLRSYDDTSNAHPFFTRHIGRMKTGIGLLPSYLAVVPGAAVSPAVAMCKSIFTPVEAPMGLLKYHYFRFVNLPAKSLAELVAATSPKVVEYVQSTAGREYVRRMCSYPPLSAAHQAIEGAKLLTSRYSRISAIAVLLFDRAVNRHHVLNVEPTPPKFCNVKRTVTGKRITGIEKFTCHVVASCTVSLGGLSRLLIVGADGKGAEIVGTTVRTQFQLQPVDTYVHKLEMTAPLELSWWAPDRNSVVLSADAGTNDLLFSDGLGGK